MDRIVVMENDWRAEADRMTREWMVKSTERCPMFSSWIPGDSMFFGLAETCCVTYFNLLEAPCVRARITNLIEEGIAQVQKIVTTYQRDMRQYVKA